MSSVKVERVPVEILGLGWLGFDHLQLTYRHAGRDFRLTDIAGEVIEDVLA